MPRLTLLLYVVAAPLVGVAALGCSTSSSAGTAAPEVFVPFPSDFCNYTSWTTYVEPDAGGDGVIAQGDGGVPNDGGFVHAPGGRIEYINHTPPHGATEFPVGTIIVKSIPGQQQTFAMAKVGGGYNANGPEGQALNWEWVEVTGSGCNVSFVWQGSTPPANQAYGGTPQACNQCHSGFPANDFVASPRILLKDY